MEAYKMLFFLFVVSVVQSASPHPDSKKLENLEKQVQILSNIVQAQSNIMARFSCNGQTGTSLDPTSQCIVKIASQAKEIAKLQGEVKTLHSSNKAQQLQIQQLQTSVKNFRKRITDLETNVKSVDAKYALEVSKLRSEIKSVDQKNNHLGNTVTNLGTQVKQLSDAWPSGKYCILASGACPPGFSRSSGYMRAISLFAGKGTYIRQGTFGDSKIKCHGRCGQYGHWIGELYLTTCCK